VALAAFDPVTLIDRFGGDFEDISPDIAFITEFVPTNSSYKDIFDKPTTLQQVCNHLHPFQSEKWRESIRKEYSE